MTAQEARNSSERKYSEYNNIDISDIVKAIKLECSFGRTQLYVETLNFPQADKLVYLGYVLRECGTGYNISW